MKCKAYTPTPTQTGLTACARGAVQSSRSHCGVLLDAAKFDRTPQRSPQLATRSAAMKTPAPPPTASSAPPSTSATCRSPSPSRIARPRAHADAYAEALGSVSVVRNHSAAARASPSSASRRSSRRSRRSPRSSYCRAARSSSGRRRRHRRRAARRAERAAERARRLSTSRSTRQDRLEGHCPSSRRSRAPRSMRRNSPGARRRSRR